MLDLLIRFTLVLFILTINFSQILYSAELGNLTSSPNYKIAKNIEISVNDYHFRTFFLAVTRADGDAFQAKISFKRKSGQIEINGPAAKKVNIGDTVLIISYASMSIKKAKNFKPSVIFPNKKNKLV